MKIIEGRFTPFKKEGEDFRSELCSTLYKDFVAYDSLKAQPFHLLYLNPHHYTENGSTEVVVNYDLQSVIIIKLCSADASFKTPAVSFQDQSPEERLFSQSYLCSSLCGNIFRNIHPYIFLEVPTYSTIRYLLFEHVLH